MIGNFSINVGTVKVLGNIIKNRLRFLNMQTLRWGALGCTACLADPRRRAFLSKQKSKSTPTPIYKQK